jgi:hypothetical protein
MKTYVITSGIIFGLLALAHVGRVFAESRALAKDPTFLIITLAAAAMCVWAMRVGLRAERKS